MSLKMYLDLMLALSPEPDRSSNGNALFVTGSLPSSDHPVMLQPGMPQYDSSTGVIGWKAWYDNDQFFTSATTAWTDLPTLGVLVIMLYFGGTLRRVMCGTEYYVMDGTTYNHQPTTPASGLIKQAPTELIPEAEFNTIYATAMADFVIP